MIRPTLPSSLRKTAGLVGVAGVLALAGCTSATEADEATATTDDSSSSTSTSTSTPSASATTSTSDTTASDSGYTDGTYTAEGSYQTPETVESISVTLTIADGVVTAVDVTGDPQAQETERYQSAFIGGIEDEVVGVALDDLDVSRVAGSSLTSNGFNQAVEDIKEQAAA